MTVIEKIQLSAKHKYLQMRGWKGHISIYLYEKGKIMYQGRFLVQIGSKVQKYEKSNRHDVKRALQKEMCESRNTKTSCQDVKRSSICCTGIWEVL